MANNREQAGKNTGHGSGFYNEDLSRKAVGRLFNDDVKVETKTSAPAATAKKPSDDAQAEQSDKEYFDYINRTSQRNKKEIEMKDAYRENIKKNREQVMKEPIRESHKPKEGYADSNPIGAVVDFFVNSEARYIIVGVSVFVLILFVFLIVKINSTGAKLKEITAENAVYAEQDKAYQALQIENGDLKSQVASLNAEINELNIKVSALEASATPENTGANADTPGTTGTPGTTTPAGGGKTHTVASGDNIWKIANTYYGSGSQANMDKIYKANNITEATVIQPGMKLIIP